MELWLKKKNRNDFDHSFMAIKSLEIWGSRIFGDFSVFYLWFTRGSHWNRTFVSFATSMGTPSKSLVKNTKIQKISSHAMFERFDRIERMIEIISGFF